MDVCYLLLLLIVTRLAFAVLQMCRELKLHQVAHQNKRIKYGQISCLYDLSIEQCALECVLIKACKSFNHAERKKKSKMYNTMCELNNLNMSVETSPSYFEDNDIYVYIDIQDWPKEVAGTCAHRPCAENQRCFQTTPYRCITIDCGTLPAEDTITIPIQGKTSLGSKGKYVCLNPNNGLKLDTPGYGDFICTMTFFKLCNSDSSWAIKRLNCFDKPQDV